MNIFRFINRQFNNILFHLSSHGILLRGKGIVKRIHCSNFGEGNVVIIDAGASLRECTLYFKGNNNTLHISCGTHLIHSSFHFEDNQNVIDIGDSVTSEEGLLLAACESCKIVVGNDCMFSNNIQVRTSDSHSILNSENKRINHAADIEIGNHVWLGENAMVLKGCHIPNGSVVGARSVVTSSLESKENSIIIGSPAKVIKENISWNRPKDQ